MNPRMSPGRSRSPRLSQLPLNALRAFEASARHLSFTRAGLELRVTQAAVSQQVKGLEHGLGAELFRRLPRGLALTDEGQALLPAVAETFARLNETLDRFKDGDFTHAVTVGVVGTFATGWLLPRLPSFAKSHPRIDVRILTNNNRVDLAGEGLDYAIRFGDGSWHATEATELLAAPLAPLCAPSLAGKLRKPADLGRETLLRSYRPDEWTSWFGAARCRVPRIRGPIFDSSITMAQAAIQGAGVALLPATMFTEDVRRKRLVQLFDIEVPHGAYWLTSLRSRRPTPAMQSFRTWLLGEIRASRDIVARAVKPRAGSA